MRDEITIVYYTANFLNEKFIHNTQEQLLKVIGDTPLISVSKKPMNFGQNICVGDTPRNHIWTWRQALIGAKAAKTKYIGLAEDDAFYSPDHFYVHTPTPDTFAYNSHFWSLYTWHDQFFSWSGEVRRMHSLISERDLFVATIEELFAKYPNDDEFPVHKLGEPGRYEQRQGTTPRKSETFHSVIPNIIVCHTEAIGFASQGTRKKHGFLRAAAIPDWGSVDDILKLCQG